MKLISTTFALMLMASGVVFAADKHDHGHGDKPLHGGLVTEIKDMDYELVAKPDVTLPLFCGVHNPRFTRPFCAVPRTSIFRTASG